MLKYLFYFLNHKLLSNNFHELEHKSSNVSVIGIHKIHMTKFYVQKKLTDLLNSKLYIEKYSLRKIN